MLYKYNNGVVCDFRSRSFRDFDDLVRFFGSEGRGVWDRAEIVERGKSVGVYSAEDLIALGEGRRSAGGEGAG